MKDKELLKIVKSFTKGMTNGDIRKKCFMVTWPLSSYLKMIGVENKLIEGEVETPTEWWGHYWIELPDKRIIDPTAGQFKELNMPSLYFGNLPKEYKIIKPHLT